MVLRMTAFVMSLRPFTEEEEEEDIFTIYRAYNQEMQHHKFH